MMQPTNPASPVLSILVPAYNYVSGVLQIVIPLLKEDRTDLEILVHDDSNDDNVERSVRALLPSNANLHYVRNRLAHGAIDNWNGLLAAARGRYVLLIHHDDFPLSEHFASKLIDELEGLAWPDAMLLTCITHDVVHDRLRLGVCNLLRQLIVRRWPAYLLRRNVIGPPAALVVRREIFTPFDSQLKWLVDVDSYYRFLVGNNCRIELSRLIMVSSTGLPGAITTSIQNEKSNIRDIELAYITNKLSPSWFWKVLRGETLAARLASNMEWLLWAAIKVVSVICGIFVRPHVSLTAVKNRRDHDMEGA